MKKITVYCGSSTGFDGAYAQKVRELAGIFVENGIELVYGAGSVGLMGVMADEMLRLEGRVTGIIPQFLMNKEVGHTGITHLEVTPDMHSRKARMIELADGFIAMPGGFGTMDEIFEVLTWRQLNLLKGPVAFYNTKGYFDSLLQFLQTSGKEGFVKPEYIEELIVEEDPEILLERMKNFTSRDQDTGKWVNK